MAFCNSCGANLEPGSKFCNQCGAPVVAGSSVPSVTPAAPAPTSRSSAGLRLFLIVAAIIVAVGILGVATLSYVVYHAARNARVTREGEHVKVETPIGTFSSNDSEQAMRELGVEIYPGAQPQKNGAATATFGGVHTVGANFQTSDPVDKVCSFYKANLPTATVKTSDQSHCTIVSSDAKNAITINIASSGDGTRFSIASVSKNAGSTN